MTRFLLVLGSVFLLWLWSPADGFGVYWKTCTTGYRCAKEVVPQYFPGQVHYVLGIIRCETGGTFSMYARGAAGERSWYQIHPVHFGWVDEYRLVRNPRYASSVAYRISKGGRDWSAWACA